MVNLKSLVIFLTIVFVTAVPLQPMSKAVEREQKFKIETDYSWIPPNHPAATSRNYQTLLKDQLSKAEEANTRNYRLPNNTIPLHYNIRIGTEIHRADFTFTGIVRINIRVLEESNTITLQSRQMIIQRIILYNVDGTNFQSGLFYTFDSDLEFLVITSERQFEVDQELIVEITYIGILSNFMDRGFFRSSYVNPETNETHWLAATQFMPVNTRQAFPCYDEVRFRTTIQLNIYHHRSFNAISNMPVSRITGDGDYVTTVFEETPPIPIILLVFTVSNFNFISNNNEEMEMRVYARPAAIAAGQADDGLHVGETMLNALVQIFDLPYPLPKSDQVAMPEFSSNGANNWGLLSFSEPVLLKTSDDPIAQHFREIRSAHEYSHIYFANLVSPISWAYAWLNEGFATLYEVILNDIVFPENNQWEEFLVAYFDASMSSDIFDNMDPLNRYAESPAEIRSKFTFISYFKGALVLRMFQEAFSEPTWVKGVGNYLREMQYRSASPDDLFNGLQQAYDEDYPENDLNVSSLMNTWLNFGGFPVVTVSRIDGNLILSQEGFRTTHEELFSIPINFATASYPDFDNTVADFWLETEELEISPENAAKTWTDEDWIILNLKDTGYYVTNYDDNIWRQISAVLISNHELIHFLNRGTLFADFHRFLTENYEIRATNYLEMMQSLPLERHPHVWVRASAGSMKFEQRLRGTILHSSYTDFLQNILNSVYNNRPFDDPAAMEVVNRLSCISGVQECLDDALNVLVEVMETGSTSFQFEYRCNGFLTANETVWMHFFGNALESAGDRTEELWSLVCTQNPNLIRFFLDQTLDMENGLTTVERHSIIIASAGESQTSFEVTIHFIEENHEAINSQISNIFNFVLVLAASANTEEQAEKLLALTYLIPEGSPVDYDMITDIIEPNLSFFRRNSDELNVWLNDYLRGLSK